MEVCSRDSLDKLLAQQSLKENSDITYVNYLKTLARYHFHVKAITQDILQCRHSMEELNELNQKGRAMIAKLREEIDSLEVCARETSDPKYMMEVESQRHQLASTLSAFKEANISSLFAIEKAQREELMHSPDRDEPTLKNRKKVDRDGLVQVSSGVTEQLLSISRQLADTTLRSQHTLDNLVSSSSTVHGTQSELENTAGSIAQSSKLLKKYGRREFTDKLIMFFAFLFFVAVCLYIVNKRIF